MIHYYLNLMGPINEKWLRENGTHWAAGRIDISDLPDEIYGMAYSVPVMHSADFFKLALWLREYQTEELVSFETIINEYEKYNGKIVWFKNE